jgi:hypothetical protein
MKPAESDAWDNEPRWDYVHAVLSMDAIVPLYDYTGIPFQGELTSRFVALLRSYYSEVYLNPSPSAIGLSSKRDRLLRPMESLFGTDLRDRYVSWLVYVFFYRNSDLSPGWSEWQSIFMRCSVRAGGWQRLGLPADKDETVRRELEDAKARIEDARDIRSELQDQPRSRWDLQVMAQRGMDEDLIDSGQPFSAIMLTVNSLMFFVFWVRMMRVLNPADADRLWEHAKVIAADLGINPHDVPHPEELKTVVEA